MQKKIKVIILFVLVLALTVCVAATSIVSPALNVISKRNSLIKSGLIYSDIYFSENDFKKCLGVPTISSVKVEELPSATDGILKLGTLNVTEGQTINSEYLSSLRLVFTSEKVTGANFMFSCNGMKIPCTVKVLDEVNFSPAFAENNTVINTYNDVSCYGRVQASDPEGDLLDYQVVMYPEHGTLNVTDSARGNYIYKPTNGYIGKDSFTLVARDEYGNYSSPKTVSVSVERNTVSFSDTVGHWCENAAICLYSKDVIEVATFNDGLHFFPDDSITREEFVVMAMKTLGVKTLTETNTSFIDNSDIDIRYRPYIATAQRLGYVNGKEVNGEIYFDPKGEIKKSEAAVVINSILNLEEGKYVTTFADDGSIPTWAKSAVYALTSAGVFNGNDEGSILPSAVLSRAHAVQMLYNISTK